MVFRQRTRRGRLTSPVMAACYLFAQQPDSHLTAANRHDALSRLQLSSAPLLQGVSIHEGTCQ